jgi:hypothetical protein
MMIVLGAASALACTSQGSGDVQDAGQPTIAAHVDLNDVSFLYPLPSWEARDDLLRLSSAGDQGALLTRSTYDGPPALAVFTPSGPSNADVYEDSRVVGVRVDPCFAAGESAASGCKKQIRLIVQPILPNPDASATTLTTGDAALHLLYDLDDAQWAGLVRGLADLQALAGDGTRGKPLGVHPVIEAEGLRGPYATALNALVLRYAGEATLARIARMVLNKVDIVWTFDVFDRDGAGLELRAIPRSPGLRAGRYPRCVHVI